MKIINKLEIEKTYNDLLKFLVKLNPSLKKNELDVKDSLLEKGVIDSFMALELINFIEKKFKIKFSNFNLSRENFGSIEKIVKQIIKNKKKDKN